MKLLKNSVTLAVVGILVVDIMKTGLNPPSVTALDDTLLLWFLVHYIHVLMGVYIVSIYFNDPLIRLLKHLKKVLKPTFR